MEKAEKVENVEVKTEAVNAAPASETINPNQTLYVRNLNEKIKVEGSENNNNLQKCDKICSCCSRHTERSWR